MPSVGFDNPLNGGRYRSHTKPSETVVRQDGANRADCLRTTERLHFFRVVVVPYEWSYLVSRASQHVVAQVDGSVIQSTVPLIRQCVRVGNKSVGDELYQPVLVVHATTGYLPESDIAFDEYVPRA